jgi:Tfp pilus assembly protein PilE
LSQVCASKDAVQRHVQAEQAALEERAAQIEKHFASMIAQFLTQGTAALAQCLNDNTSYTQAITDLATETQHVAVSALQQLHSKAS